MPFRQAVVSVSLPHHHWIGPLFRPGHSQILDHVSFCTRNRKYDKQLYLLLKDLWTIRRRLIIGYRNNIYRYYTIDSDMLLCYSSL